MISANKMRDVHGLKANEGFSLIELTAAIFVASIVIFGTVKMYSFGLDKVRSTVESGIALRAIQNEIETLRSMPFDALEPIEDGAFVSKTDELDRLHMHVVRLTIRPRAEVPGDLYEVKAGVSWIGDNGRSIEKQVWTMIARKD